MDRPPKQAGKTLRRRIKVALIERQLTARRLAEEVGHDLSVVSKAINHGQFPRVREKIRRLLNV